ncbi:MAG TPA: hypothetical protein VN853_20450 [Polyangia bacterium]|jgi:uncharacterized membrane protein YgcG|nr:hypothetical protein [Polyangia bacterium]
MSQLLPCPACSRHVDAAETACPFCAAVLSESFRTMRPPAPPRRRLSRAALMAAGATLVGAAACSSSAPSPGTGSGGASGSTGETGGSSGSGGTAGTGGEPARDAGQDRSVVVFYGAPVPAGSARPGEPPR